MRERQTPAGVEAQIRRHLQKFGVHGDGADWVLCALNPSAELKCTGLPDASATPVIRPRYRIAATITPPEDVQSWDCFMWSPPGDVNALYVATGPSGVDFTANVPPPNCAVSVVRLQSSTSQPNGTEFQFTAPLGDTFAVTSLPNTNAQAFRTFTKGITVHQISAAVSDQGQVYAAQFAPVFRSPGGIIPDGYDSGVVNPRGGGNYPLFGQQYSCVLPADEVSLTAMARDFYMGPSREGIYMPLRLTGPSQPFARSVPPSVGYQAAGIGFLRSTDSSFFPCGAVLRPSTETTAPNIPWVFQAPTVKQFPPVALPELMFDTGYDNTNIGVMIWRGLNGSGGGFQTSLQVKVIAGLEIVPRPAASDRVFVEPPADYDPKAIEAYYSLSILLDDAYPARFNSFQDILNAIGGAVSKVWDVVEPTLKQVVPVLGQAAMSALGRRAGIPLAMPVTGARAATPRVTYRAPSVARSATKKAAPKARRRR